MSLVIRVTDYLLNHIPFILLMLACIVSIWIISTRDKRRRSSQNVNTFIAYVMLLPVGIAGLWAFVFHAFFPAIAARFIGWQPSPFEFEVAVANLGLGLMGLFSFRASKGFRTATTLFAACFLWGSAIGHIRQMTIHSNFTPGNAGSIFYTDIIIQLLLIVLLMLYNSKSKHVFITK